MPSRTSGRKTRSLSKAPPAVIPETVSAKGGVLLWSLVAATLLLHLLTAANYPLFRDELYNLDLANHLDWGYVDQPPLAIAMLAGWKAVAGDSVFSVRVLPALAGALLILLTWRLTAELGGGRFARALASLLLLLSPGERVLSGQYSMIPFDFCFWAVLLLILIRICNTGDTRLWLLFGAVAGIALMNRVSPLYLGLAVVVGVAFTGLRPHFRSWHFWAGGALAALIFSPYILWQFPHHWATLEFFRNEPRFTSAGFVPLDALLQLTLENNPLSAPVWLAGILALLVWSRFRQWRALGWTVLAVFVIVAVFHGKPYYVAGLHPLLLAAGSISTESWVRRTGMRAVLISVFVVSGVLLMPFGLRVLSPADFLKYNARVNVLTPGAAKSSADRMPQIYGDSFGWKEMTATVAQVYDSLSPEQRADCVILATDYGQAGAINYYGRRFGLPRAHSMHENYYFWGPPPVTDRTTFIWVEHSSGHPERVFREVRLAATHDHPYAALWERHVNVTVATGPRIPFAELWRRGKMFK
jgi:hypothetical protein